MTEPSDLDRTMHRTTPAMPRLGAGSSGFAQLVVLEGPLQGQMVDWRVEQPLKIGRLDDNDLVLASPDVSKHHAVLTIDDEHVCYVEDLGSTNGVFVNGSRLPSDVRRRLAHGDNVRITDHLILFRQKGCFHDASGLSEIRLDGEKIRADVDAFLSEIGGLPDSDRA